MKTSKKNNINKALSISVISLFILVFCFWERAQAKNTITNELESPAGQTYPIEPTSNEGEGLYQTYPLEPPPTAESTLVIPTDQIVGITNTGRIIEVPQEVIDYVNQVLEEHGHFTSPGHIPEGLPVAPDIIIGPDERYPIGDTNIYYPYSAVVYVGFNWPDSATLWCTGWMVSPSTVVTAAHCIYDPAHTEGPWIENVIVIPGYNINSSMPIPFGSCNGYEYYVLSPWFYDNQPMEFDYGFIHLNCTIGHQSGYLEFSPYDDPGTGKFLQLVGYPQDKDLLYGREMWFSSGYLLYSEPLFTFYDNDTYYGESGAPV